MNLITPFDFIAMMPEQKSIAMVGNAPSLRNCGLGPWIESHDIVVRFNECAIQDFESDVGLRTDILVSNPYSEKRTRPPLDGLNRPKVVLVLNPQTRRGGQEFFEQWVGDLAVLFSYNPDLKSIQRSRKDISLSTGTYALPLLANILRPKKISILGFTMFLPGSSTHYWEPQVTPPGLRAHSPHREAEIFIDLINTARASVEVTSDVRWVADVVGVPLRKNITVRDLAGWSPPTV